MILDKTPASAGSLLHLDAGRWSWTGVTLPLCLRTPRPEDNLHLAHSEHETCLAFSLMMCEL